MPSLTSGVCAYCGTPASPAELCAHDHAPDDGRWGTTNRIMCDLLHRGIDPPRLSEADRWDGPRDAEVELPSEVLTAAV